MALVDWLDSLATCAGGNPDSNTLISDMTTVICLDDYHCLDRKGRSAAGVTALAPEAQNFDLMYEQVCTTGGQGLGDGSSGFHARGLCKGHRET